MNDSRVMVHVFYESFMVSSIEEIEAYPLSEMLNELAGIFGLFFGFSVITVAVLITAGVQIVTKAIRKFLRRSKTYAVSSLDTLIRYMFN